MASAPGMLRMLPSPLKAMGSLHSRPMVNRAMDHMPNLLLLMEVTLRQHLLLLQATLSSSNSMDPPTPSQQQLAILLPSQLPIPTLSQPRVMEPVVMTALLLLLLLLPPSLTALSQDILLSLPTLVMASRLLPLHHRVTMLAASQPVTAKVPTPSQQLTASNNLATKPSRLAMVITGRMARVEVLVTLVLSLQGMPGQGRAGALAEMALIVVE
ncbi:hypothetical protein EYF80_036863 [Liparis tanakae]|uniref:Uncharacterized protein n=1 Tax=Liparis tanakae TaxID=230148 RepID=A0A4Z2GI97_9TELE|nr:hypothetical protein EYF80_036863 [Liparis tanakae]